MKIYLNRLSKRYQNHWIFKNVDYVFESGNKYAVLGANGSGKSTLLRIIAGMQGHNAGSLQYEQEQKNIAPENIYKYVSYCAPGMELIEEMTLNELLRFHFSFKQVVDGYSFADIAAIMQLADARDKPIGDFSSGMKQRAKLAVAFFSDTPVLLLDEPCSNLDAAGIELYNECLNQYTGSRLVIIASNEAREYEQAGFSLSIEDYK